MFLSAWRVAARKAQRKGSISRASQKLAAGIRKWPLLCLELLEDRTLPSTFQWTGLGTNANWSNTGNWLQTAGSTGVGYPNAVGDIAQFTGNFAGSPTVSLNQAITVGEIDFASSTGISITSAGSNSLTLTNSGSSSSIINLLSSNTGVELFNAPIKVASGTLAATVSGGTLQLNNSGVPANVVGSGSTFTVNGGTLSVTGGANTGAASITVSNGGTLSVSGTGTLASTPTLTALTLGTILVNDNAGVSQSGRFGANTNLVLGGGSFSYIGANNAASTDALGTVTLTSGNSTFSTTPTGTGTVTLTSAGLFRQTGATVNFTGTGLGVIPNQGSPTNQLFFTAGITTVGNKGGIIPYATWNTGDFATYTSAGGIAQFTNYLVNGLLFAGPNDTVKLTTSVTLAGNLTVNAIVFATPTSAPIVIAEDGFTLTVASGAILEGAPAGPTAGGGTIIGGTLAFGGTGEGIILSNTANAGATPAGGVFGEYANINGVVPTTAAGATAAYTNFPNFGPPTPPAGEIVQLITTRIDPTVNGQEAPLNSIANGFYGPYPENPVGLDGINFLQEWTGYLNVIQAGIYTFFSHSDDASVIFLDNNPTPVVASVYTGNDTTAGTPQYLTAGYHNVLLIFTQNGGQAYAGFGYDGPDTDFVPIIIPEGSGPFSPGFFQTVGPTPESTVIQSSINVGASGALTVSGGELVLPLGNLNFAGTTYLAGGIVGVGNNASLGTSTLNITSGAINATASVTLSNKLILNNSTFSIGGNNDITLSSPSGNTVTGVNTLNDNNLGITTLSAPLSGSGSISVIGSGNLVVTGASTYSGGTILAGGNLVVGASSTGTTSGPLGTGTLTLSGGTLYSDAGARTLSNPLALSGTVSLTASSANGASSTGSSVTFAGTAYIAANTVLTVNDTVSLTGLVSGPGQLTVQGIGSLALTNAANTYSGGTILNAGTLGALGTLTVAGSSGITGGALTSGSLGTGPLTIANGTLAASGSGVTIANQLNLGTGYIAFGGANPIVFSQAGITTPPTNALSGPTNSLLLVNTATTINDVLSGLGGLTLFSALTPTTTLTLTQNDSFTGSTIVNAGTLVVTGASGQLSGTSSFSINAGATLTVDDRTNNLNNRLNPNSVSFALDGGNLNVFGGGTSAATTSSENLALGISLIGGSSNIMTTPGTGGAIVQLNLNFITRSQGATVNFQAGTGTLGSATNQILVSTVSGGTVGNIIVGATVTDATSFAANTTGYNLAKIGANGVTALGASDYVPLNPLGNQPTDNVLVSSGTFANPGPITATQDTANSLLVIGPGINVQGKAGVTLTLTSGMVASSGGTTTANSISVPTLAMPAGVEAIALTNTGADTISSVISGSGGLTIGGPGTLMLAGTNAYTGAPTPTSEVQQINVQNATTGTYTLSFNGATTAAIAATASAATIQTALAALGTIRPGNVLVTQPALNGTYTVTFVGTLAGQVLPQMVITSNLLFGVNQYPVATVTITTSNNGMSSTFLDSGTLIVGANNAIDGGLSVVNGTIQATAGLYLTNGVSLGTTSASGQLSASGALTIAANSQPIFMTGGLTMNGLTATITTNNSQDTIASVIGNSSNSTMSAALVKLGAGTLVLTAPNTYTGPTLISAGTVLATNGSMAASFENLGAAGATVATQIQTAQAGVTNYGSLGASESAIQVITFSSGVTGGTFTLSYGGVTTAPIAYVANSSDQHVLVANVQSALNGLLGTGNTMVVYNNVLSGLSSAVPGLAIYFLNNLADINVPLMGFTSNLTGAAPSMTIATTTLGEGNPAVVAAGATLQFQGGVQNPNAIGAAAGAVIGAFGISEGITIPQQIVLQGGTLENIDGNNNVSGQITLAAASNFKGDGYFMNVTGDITGPGDLNFTGGGAVYLSANSFYTGSTNINSGQVIVNDTIPLPGDNGGSDSYLGSSVGGVVVAAGATLQLNRAGLISGKPLTLNGGGDGFLQAGGEINPIGALENSSGNVWTGTITLATDSVISSSPAVYDPQLIGAYPYPSTFAITGLITGPGGLTIDGGIAWGGSTDSGGAIGVGVGTTTYADAYVEIGATASYTGGTTVLDGTLVLNDSGILSQASTKSVNAVQTITFGGTVTGGTFTLAFNGATTTPIVYSATATALASNIQAALGALSQINPGNTLVSASSSTNFTVTFQNQLAAAVLPTMTAVSSLTGTSPTIAVVTATAGVAPITVMPNAGLTVDNSQILISNRLAGTNITLYGNNSSGPDNTAVNNYAQPNPNSINLLFLGNINSGVATTVSLGLITLASGKSTITSQIGSSGNTTNLTTSAGLLRLPGATATFSGGTVGSTSLPFGPGQQFVFANPPVLTNGILPYVAVGAVAGGGNLNFATYNLTGTPGLAANTNFVTSLPSATSPNQPTLNVVLTANATLFSNVTVNSLILSGSSALTVAVASGNNYTVNIASGGLMATSAAATLAGGTLNFGAAEGIVTGNQNLTITSVITGSGGLTDSDSATLALGSAGGVGTGGGGNAYTGTTTLNAGNLTLANATALSSGPLNWNAGTLDNNVSPTFTVTNPVNFNNSTVILGTTNSMILSGPVTLTGNNFFQVPFPSAITGVISGTGSLYLTNSAGGSNSLLITNALNTFSGGSGVGSMPQGNNAAPQANLQIDASDTFQNAVQTVTFTGLTNGATFALAFTPTLQGTPTGATLTTGSITYSTTPATLQINIQAALDGLANIGPGNTLISAASASSVTVTFQGDLSGTSIANLTSPTTGVAIATTTVGKVLSGPLGTGPINFAYTDFYMQNYAGIQVASQNNLVSDVVVPPVVTLHNPINLLNAGLRVAGAQAFGGGNLNFAGPVNLQGTNQLQVASNVQTTFSGVISGTGNILYNGSAASLGYLVLTGNNSFAGGLTMNSTNVDLTIGNSNALGSGALILDGGVIQDDGQHAYTINNLVEIDGGTNVLYASSSANAFTFTAPIIGNGNLSSKVGPGNLILQGAGLYSGSTTINQGTLTLSGGGALLNTSSITVNPGTSLTLDNTAVTNSNRIADVIPISLLGATLNFVGTAGAASSETLGPLTLGAGTVSGTAVITTAPGGGNTITSSSGVGGSAALTITSLTRAAGGLLSLVAPASSAANIGSSTNQITIAGAINPPPTATSAANGSFILPWATVIGNTGSVDFASVPNSSAPFPISPFAGYVTGGISNVNSPLLDVVKVQASDPAGSNNITSTAQVNALLIVGDNLTVGGGGSLTLTSGAIVVAGATTMGDTVAVPLILEGEGLFSSFSSPATSGNGGLNITGAISSSYSAAIATSVNASMAIGGTGSVELSGTNTIAAGTVLSGGTLMLNNTSAIGAVANPLVVAGRAGLQAGPGGVNFANPVTLSIGQGLLTTYLVPGTALTVGGSSANPLTLSGVITGAGGLTVNSGTVVLAGTAANSQTGFTVVNSGLLTLAKTAALNALAGPVVINGGTVQESTNFNQLNTQPLFINSTNAVETLTFTGNPTSGNFNLSYGGATTGAIAYSTTATTLASNIQTALNGLSTIGGGSSVVSVSGLTVTVQFQAALAGSAGSLSSLTAANISLNAGAGITAAATIVTPGATGTLNLGADSATVNYIVFTNGGLISMLTGSTLTVNQPSIQAVSNNGAPNTALISGGALTFGNAASPNRAVLSTTVTGSSGSSGTIATPVQTITFTGTPTAGAGNFTLTFNGQTTNPIAYPTAASALASNIQSALNTLSTIAAIGNVTASAASLTSVAVSFPNVVAGTIVAPISANGAAVSTVQTLTFPGNATGGTFILSFNGQTTSPIPFSTTPAALAASIQTALNSLSTLSAVNAVDTINFGGTSTTGTFTLTFAGQTTTAITYNSVASNLQANILNALNALSTINSVGGVATNTINVAIGGTATAVTVTFQNALGGRAEPATQFSASNAGITFATTTTGAPSTANVTLVSAASPTSVNVTFQNALTGGAVTTTMGGNGAASNAVQQISFAGVSGGSFTLVANGTTTGTIAFSTTNSTLQTNIQNALNTALGSGNTAISVTGLPAIATITFQGALAGLPQNALTLNATPLSNTVQTISFPGIPTAGTFTLVLNGQTTGSITFSTNPATLQTAIQTALNATSIGAGNSVVSAISATSVTVTFQNALAGGQVTGAGSGTSPSSAPLIPGGVNAQQTITFPATVTNGGTFTLAYTKSGTTTTTAAITYSTNPTTLASSIQTALTGLASLGANNVTVFSNAAATIATVNFQGAQGSQTQTNLVANGTPINAVQTLSFTGTVTGGSFKLTYNGVQTPAIAYSTNPGTLQANIQTALDALTSVGAGNTLVLANATATGATITFQNALGGLPQTPGFSVDGSGLLGTTAAATIATTTAGIVGLTGGNPVVASTLTGSPSTITVAVTTPGFGLVTSAAPVITSIVTGGQGGLTGGSSNTVSAATTTTGFGLSGTNPGISAATSTPGFGGDLIITSAITGAISIDKAGGGILTYAGTAANSYSGVTSVGGGTLVLAMQANANAYSGPLAIYSSPTGSASVLVKSNFSQLAPTQGVVLSGPGATLDLSGTTAAQTITTLDMRGSTVTMGSTATLNLAGTVTGEAVGTSTSTISGRLALTATQTFSSLDSGSTPGLTISAVISGSAFGITKQGTGTLVLSGVNTYTGPTIVNEGTLLLSGTGLGVPGTLVIGDGIGGSGTAKGDVVRLAASSKLSSTAAVTINNSGLLDLGGNNQTIGALTISGGSITTEAGTLTLGSNVSSVANPANSTPASISGNLALGATRTFDVQQGTLSGADMVISALISGANQGLNKIDTGTLQLTANNTYTGTTTVALGDLQVDGTQTASNVALNGGVLGGTGTTGQVIATGGGTIHPGEPITNPGVFTATSPIGTPSTVDLSGGGNLTITFNALTTAGMTYSQEQVTGLGILKLGGTSSLTLDVGGLSGPGSTGTASAVILYSGLEGTFSTVNIINNPLNLTPVLNYKPGQIDISLIGPAARFVVSAPSTTVAGVAFNFTVNAVDQFGNPASVYAGTIHFSSTDTSANVVLPANATLTGGTGTFSATLITATQLGLTPTIQTITATDTASSTVTGNAAVTVNPATATHFAVGVPTTVAAGDLLVYSVTAEDAFNNVATGYSGTIHFTSSDSQAGLPLNKTLPGGAGFFAASLHTAGNQTISATDTSSASITGVSNFTSVTAGAVTHFGVTAPATAAPGSSFTITVTAQDQFNNKVGSYAGTVHFASSDPAAALPGDTTLVNGSSTFNVTLKAAGVQTISATDTASTAISTIVNVAVNAATVNHFTVSAPGSVVAGNPFSVVITAKDQFGNTVTGYTGTIHFSSSDSQPALPADTTLTAGVGFFGGLLRTAGSQTITATDTASAALTGTSAPISVSGLAANHIGLFAPAKAVTGTPFPLTVEAQDQFGNVFTTYTGVVHFSSTDPNAALPANTTLTNGVATFNVTLKSPGTQTISANDIGNPNIVGTSNTIATLGLVVTGLTPTSTGFIAVFNKPFDPSQINLYDNSGANGPDDVLLTGPGASQTSTHGSLIIDPSNQTITFVKTSTFTTNVNSFNPQTGVLTAGTYTVTFRSAANGFVDSLGAPLDGTASGNPAGSNYTTTFVVAATPTLSVGIPGFARGPNSAQTINLPNNLTFGIPLNLSTGAGVTAGKFTLQYNSALLSITGVTVNSVLTGATLTYDSASTAGSAVIDFSSPTPLTAGPVRLGGLVATVPNSAAPLYTQKALLHWSSVSVNGGATAAVGDDAVDVNAYFGDANGDGTLSGGDASQISQVATGVNNNPATGTIGGFSAFRLADPVLIGDLTASGTVGAGAVTLMNSFLSGTPRAQIPALPTGLTIPANGVDPALSIPTNLQATAGGIVVVPVQIDSGRPTGSTGVTEAILAVQYDPAEFTVSAQDVRLGNLPLSGSGWQLQTAINAQTGQIGIDLFSTMPFQTSAAGTLVTISFQARENAVAGSTGINLVAAVNPTGSRSFVTTVSDAQGAMELHTAETTLGLMPGSPGSVTVASNQWAFGSDQSAASSEQTAVNGGAWVVNSKGDSSSALPTIHSPLSAALIEQVFGDMQPMMMPQESAVGQPGVILGSSVEDQPNANLSDSMLQKTGLAQHDWVSDDMVAYLGQAAKSGRGALDGDLVDANLSGQDTGDIAGVEEFFAAVAVARNGRI